MEKKQKQKKKALLALGLRHLNPMDILRNVFTSGISSRFLLTAVWVLFYNPLKYCQN